MPNPTHAADSEGHDPPVRQATACSRRWRELKPGMLLCVNPDTGLLVVNTKPSQLYEQAIMLYHQNAYVLVLHIDPHVGLDTARVQIDYATRDFVRRSEKIKQFDENGDHTRFINIALLEHDRYVDPYNKSDHNL